MSITDKKLETIFLDLTILSENQNHGETSFKRTTNVITVCKYQHYSQIFGGISAMQWRKAERYRRFQQHLFRLLCVRIEIHLDQLKCVNC